MEATTEGEKQGQQQCQQGQQPKQSPPTTIKHFHLDYSLPKWATIQPYVKAHQKGVNKPKNKHKLNKFTYYRLNGEVIKVLYLNDQLVIEQGTYPFTDPSGTASLTQDRSSL